MDLVAEKKALPIVFSAKIESSHTHTKKSQHYPVSKIVPEFQGLSSGSLEVDSSPLRTMERRGLEFVACLDLGPAFKAEEHRVGLVLVVAKSK